jgi:hypothetical protein
MRQGLVSAAASNKVSGVYTHTIEATVTAKSICRLLHYTGQQMLPEYKQACARWRSNPCLAASCVALPVDSNKRDEQTTCFCTTTHPRSANSRPRKRFREMTAAHVGGHHDGWGLPGPKQGFLAIMISVNMSRTASGLGSSGSRRRR